MSTNPLPLITKKDAAKLLNLSMPSIDRMIKSGKIPYVRIGESNGAVRIKPENIYKLMNGE